MYENLNIDFDENRECDKLLNVTFCCYPLQAAITTNIYKNIFI